MKVKLKVNLIVGVDEQDIKYKDVLVLEFSEGVNDAEKGIAYAKAWEKWKDDYIDGGWEVIKDES